MADLMRTLTEQIIGKGYQSDIWVNMDYYPQEYTELKPYTVSYIDYESMDADNYGSYDTRQEARQAYTELVKIATDYSKSLLRHTYTLSDYIGFRMQEGAIL